MPSIFSRSTRYSHPRPKPVFTNGLRVLRNLVPAGCTAMPNPYSLRSHPRRNSCEVGLLLMRISKVYLPTIWPYFFQNQILRPSTLWRNPMGKKKINPPAFAPSGVPRPFGRPIGSLHRGAQFVFLHRSCCAISGQNTVMLG